MMNFFPMTKKKKKKIWRALRAETRNFLARSAENFPRGSSFFLTLGRGRPTLRGKIHASGGFFAIFSLGGLSHPEVALGGVEAIFRLSEGGEGIRGYTP